MSLIYYSKLLMIVATHGWREKKMSKLVSLTVVFSWLFPKLLFTIHIGKNQNILC